MFRKELLQLMKDAVFELMMIRKSAQAVEDELLLIRGQRDQTGRHSKEKTDE